MPRTTWTINSVTGGRDDSDLMNCKIKQTDTGYDFTDTSNDVLASTTDTTAPFTFAFEYEDLNWTVTVNTLTGGPSNNQASGTWTNDDPTIQGEEDGSWTAQAGSGMDEEAEADAASATA